MGYTEMGRRIHQAREQVGLSQAELADKIGCTQSALSNYELGKRRIHLANLEQIAYILKKPLSYFIGPTAYSYSQDQALLLEDPRLREILFQAADLPAGDKERVLEYIKWRKSIILSEIITTAEVWERSTFL
jgi:transcriptional regulator with XRE-family HTH domain